MKKKSVKVLFEKYNAEDMDSVIKVLGDIKDIKRDLEQQEELLKKILLKHLKKKRWDEYYSEENKVNVSVITKSKDVVNKKVLNLLLNEAQFAQVITKRKKQELIIVTKKDREKLKEIK